MSIKKNYHEEKSKENDENFKRDTWWKNRSVFSKDRFGKVAHKRGKK